MTNYNFHRYDIIEMHITLNKTLININNLLRSITKSTPIIQTPTQHTITSRLIKLNTTIQLLTRLINHRNQNRLHGTISAEK